MDSTVSVDVRELLETIRGFGIELFVEKGIVHGRMRSGKIPFAARGWIEKLQLVNDQAAALLEGENVRERIGITVAEALPYADRVKRGKIELVGKVIYHKAADRVDIRYREVKAHGEED